MAQRLSYPSAKFRWDLPDLWPVDSCPARRNFRPSLADRIIVTCIGSRYNLARLQSRPGIQRLGGPNGKITLKGCCNLCVHARAVGMQASHFSIVF